MADQKANIGVVGMAVMGKNLALNIESRGYTVGIYNRSANKTEQVMKDHSEKKLVPSYTVEDFVKSLETPRRILLMVKAGKPTDAVIHELLPLLDKGDVLLMVGTPTSMTPWPVMLNSTSPGSTLLGWGFPVVSWGPYKVLP